jgi:hypothetical protein
MSVLYRYVPDRAARALWHPRRVPYDGALCTRIGNIPWARNQLVEFMLPGVRRVEILRVVVPWRRLRKVA